jgi:hypothetical protein
MGFVRWNSDFAPVVVRSRTGASPNEAMRPPLERNSAMFIWLNASLSSRFIGSSLSVKARQAINRRLELFIERGHADGSIRAAVNATDVIVFSAMTTQPLPHGPDRHRIAERQLAIFLDGLAAERPAEIPGPAVKREDIEQAFQLDAPRPGLR